MSATLPARANLEHIKKQSKDLRRAFADGDLSARERICANLPRASRLSDADLATAEVSLQEAQHVLAREYGYAKWEALVAAVEADGGTFDDIVRLTDREAQTLMRDVDQKDLVACLVGASEPLCERFLGNMSQRVREYLRSEIELAGDTAPDIVSDARQRLLNQILKLHGQGWIEWPPPADRPTESGAPAQPQDDPVLARVNEPLATLTIDELADIIHALADQARREGILSLERLVTDNGATLLTEGILLIVDGTEPDLVVDILEQRANTILHNRTQRAKMAIEAWMSIQSGDNPGIVAHKLSTFVVEQAEPATSPTDPSAQDLTRTLQQTPLSRMSLSQLVSFYRDVAYFARRHQLSAALHLMSYVTDEPVLMAGLRSTDPAAPDAVAMMEAMEQALAAERAGLHERQCLVVLGLAGLQRGRKPDDLTADARDRARTQAEQLPPERTHPTLSV